MGFDPLSASPTTIEKAKQDLQTINASLVLNPATHEQYLGLMGSVLVETFLNRLYENSKTASQYFYGIQTWNLCPGFIYTKPNSAENPILKDTESKFYYHPQWNIDAKSTGTLLKRNGVAKQIVQPVWDAPVNQTCRWLYGYGASYDEGRIFEEWMDTPGASTIKGLMVANEDIDNTRNKAVELVVTDILNETQILNSDFNTVTIQDDGSDWIRNYEAYDGFHFLNVRRVPDLWTDSGFQSDDSAVDGPYAAMVWNEPGTAHEYAIVRGTKFDLKSIKLSSLIDGAQYKFSAYRRTGTNTFTFVTSKTVTVNKTPVIQNFDWADINKITIVQVTTLKGPVILENLDICSR
ncbi:MAG: hypothetical protein A2298_02080 [Gammaproteobacteria bacterium RIFOXYB2_FULL_38_6]|nr:MAG: hypothetical protein A2298_02080 [Gammaproteobacteria bacterium RIFOXYB2_FULL_38_6]